MNTAELKQAFSLPDVVFGHPQRVVAAPALSHDDKIALLRKWKQALERRWRDAGAARDAIESEISGKVAAIRRALDDLRRQ
jgi:hypothetical protein